MVSVRMFFSSGHDGHSHSSSIAENFSGNLQTREASNGAVHTTQMILCGDGLTMSYMQDYLPFGRASTDCLSQGVQTRFQCLHSVELC